MHVMSIISRLARGMKRRRVKRQKEKVEKERHKNTRHISPLIYDIIHIVLTQHSFERTNLACVFTRVLLRQKARNVEL